MRTIHRSGLLVACALVAIMASSAPPATADLPNVNMEKALLAAQWDPQKPGTGITEGSKRSVIRIERALRDQGLLDPAYVDGHYGTATVAAYTDWQQSLGFSGLAANGIPGEASLTQLASGRYDVVRIVRPGPKVTFDGHTVDQRTADMLHEAESVTGLQIRLDQGSYSTSDPTSAGTHDGGGVVDINVDAWSSRRRNRVVRVLREVGFAAWLRTPQEGSWPYHIHAVAVSDPDLSPPAQAQVGDYYRGLNGLANDEPDTGPDVPKVTWEQYQRAS